MARLGGRVRAAETPVSISLAATYRSSNLRPLQRRSHPLGPKEGDDDRHDPGCLQADASHYRRRRLRSRKAGQGDPDRPLTGDNIIPGKGVSAPWAARPCMSPAMVRLALP